MIVFLCISDSKIPVCCLLNNTPPFTRPAFATYHLSFTINHSCVFKTPINPKTPTARDEPLATTAIMPIPTALSAEQPRSRKTLCKVCLDINLPKHIYQPIESPWKVWQVLSSSAPSYKLGPWYSVRRRAAKGCPFCQLVINCVGATVAAANSDHGSDTDSNSGGNSGSSSDSAYGRHPQGRYEDAHQETKSGRANRERSGYPHSQDIIELSNRASWKMCILIFNFNSVVEKVYSNRADLEKEAKMLRLKGEKEVQRLLISWEGCKAVGQIQGLVDTPHTERERGGDFGFGTKDGRFLGRVVDAYEPDWGLLRSWLGLCERSHGQLCEAEDAASAHERLPVNMRVIDVMGRRVVPYRRGWEYVALTYVWGEHLMGRAMPKMDKSRANAGAELPEWLPKTVADAMETVDRLGYRYLWVDSLCIIQDDDGDRHSQLLRMDAIYAHAAVSIAAASGDHADCGLPGISTPRRFRQHRASAKGLTFAVPLPRFDELNTSELAWNTRAWTFQEKVLSRRLLIFTDHQVYFRCSNGVWAEDTAAETTRPARRNGKNSFRWGDDKLPHDFSTRQPYSLVDFLNFGSRKLATIDTRATFANYAAVVEEYTQRTLTYQADALPAIEGVLRVLDPTPEAYVAGLPRWYFPEAILWHPKLGSSCVEMPGTGAPTWSWARWALPDGCTWQTRDVGYTKRLQNRPMFYWTSDYVDDEDFPEPRRIAFHEPETDRLPRTPERLSVVLEKSGAVLGLGVRLAQFVLGDSLRKGMSNAGMVGGVVGAFKLYSRLSDDTSERGYRKGDVVGEVVTTAQAWNDSHGFEFIELSHGRELRFASGHIAQGYQPTTTRNVWVEEPTVYDAEGNGSKGPGHYEMQTTVDPISTWEVVNVMMVERVNGVAYRRGIGKVILAAWTGMDAHRTFLYLA